MKNITRLLTLLPAVLLSGAAPEPETEAETTVKAVTRQLKLALPKAEKLDFSHPGRVAIADRHGKTLGRALYTAPLKTGAKGFRGPVPVLVVLDEADRVLTVAPLPNREDRPYWGKIKNAELLGEWSGFRPAEAVKLPVDAVTGATFTSKAVIASVRALLKEQ